MHRRSPSRSSPTGRQRRQRDPSPRPSTSSRSEQPNPTFSPYTIHQSQTSLPSIHHLHPYLPTLPQHVVIGAYNPSDPAMTNPLEVTSPVSEQRREGVDSGGGNSDQEDGPPKKKRRRQALSCTECKRRKIKCDRAQPCGPCTRRGELDKCQWNIVEPTDKYVTRAEYDELKFRFESLEASVSRLIPGILGTPGPSNVPSYSGGAGSGIPSLHQQGPITAIPPAPADVGSAVYYAPNIPTPSQTVYSAQYNPRIPHASRSPPPLTRLHMPHETTQSPTSLRPSPLSLAAITTPFSPGISEVKQSKNLQAQTFKVLLGERLRQSPPAPEDPARRSHHSYPLMQVDSR